MMMMNIRLPPGAANVPTITMMMMMRRRRMLRLWVYPCIRRGSLPSTGLDSRISRGISAVGTTSFTMRSIVTSYVTLKEREREREREREGEREREREWRDEMRYGSHKKKEKGPREYKERTEPNIQLVSLTIFGLQLLRSPKTAKLSINHYTNPGTEGLTLCHTVSGEEYGVSFLD
uniref:Uncharacterized protein n=1 Tax=Amphimedon queenslandica TaxID=400682 RepID=A0A1X7VPV5_AMPQE